MGVVSGAVLAIALLGKAAVAGSPDGFYLGTLTSEARVLDVALELKTEGNTLSGSYYYFGPARQALTLGGTIDAGGTVRLEESNPTGRVTGVWSGKLERGALTGTWKNPRTGKLWSFKLVRSEEASSYFDGPPRTVEAGSTGPITYTTVRVPASKHRVPLITAFRDRRVTSAINAMLMGAANAARCAEPPDDHSFESEVSFVTADILSVRITESWFCGAAYPTSDADRSVVFDLRTGQLISREDLFRTEATPEQIAEVLFAYELGQIRTRGAAKPEKQDSDEDDCTGDWVLDNYLHPEFHSFQLAADGFVVRPELPHAIAACTDEVTVPYPGLVSIAAPGGPLARLAATHAGAPLRYRIHKPWLKPEEDVYYTPPTK